jgi:hypothetical protein
LQWNTERRDGASVAHDIRTFIRATMFYGPLFMFLPVSCVRSTISPRGRRALANFFLGASILYAVPTLAGILWYRTLVAPIGEGGVADPIPQWLFQVLEYGFWATAFAGVVWFGVVTIKHRGFKPTYPECRKCGYNLTGNTSGTCPECGTPCQSAPAGGTERG